MAILMREDGTCYTALSGNALIGRSLRAEVQLKDPSASNVHASMRWNGAGWELRDHSSRNGTRVELMDRSSSSGKRANRLTPGEPLPIERDSIIEFGTARERWTLRDDSPPSPFALAKDGTLVVGTESMIALPSVDAPEVTAFQLADQSWVVEEAGVLRPLSSKTGVVAANTSWTIHLPTPEDGTVEVVPVLLKPKVSDIGLRFRVSRNEENVEVSIDHAQGTIILPARAHSYLLLTLARRRIADSESLPESERGWVHRDDLARMLAMDGSHLYVYILRARKQFADAGVSDAVHIIERRQGSCELRIGCRALIVEQA
jgi:hypothetical protein